jgi:hypothetical protein
MRRLGIANTMRLAHALSRVKYHRQHALRQRLYKFRFDELLAENGPLTVPPIALHDGWHIDTTMSLPHLERVLEDSEKLIHERSGRRHSPSTYRSWFQDMWTAELAEQYPSFLDFATSSDILAAVGRYLETIPVLSTTAPAGIRIVESNSEFDPDPDRPKDSQLYHIDYFSLPNVYVVVLVRDTTLEQGPWHFLPRSVSLRVKSELGYWGTKLDYRLTDEQVYSVADPQRDVIRFAYPRGSVLFIESSGCMHYGSRNVVRPRFQLMYAYTCPYRTDFYEEILEPIVYPVRPTDSFLRRLVLEKRCLAVPAAMTNQQIPATAAAAR